LKKTQAHLRKNSAEENGLATTRYGSQIFLIRRASANLSPVIQALLVTLFTWGMTALGAAVVFAGRDVSKRTLDIMLGFAAGAMIFVVVEEVIPESQASGYGDQATMGSIFGFTVMMVLDVALS